MNSLLTVTILGLLSGAIGTGTGGASVLLIKSLRDDALAWLMAFAAGIMTSIIFMELIPEAIKEGTVISALIGVILGVILIMVLDINFPHHHFNQEEAGRELTKKMFQEQKLLKMGILLAFGVALHNIPEGLAIGASYVADKNIGIGLAVLIALHNFPEGMAVATALGLAGISKNRVLVYTVLAGLPMGLGAFTGGLLGSISPLFLSASLGFAGGAMLYIVYDELIPDCHDRTTGHTAIVGIVAGVITGIALIEILH
ncbi:MAG: ZIP family metal transporter [Halarsenatibacteraceae bacterium]